MEEKTKRALFKPPGDCMNTDKEENRRLREKIREIVKEEMVAVHHRRYEFGDPSMPAKGEDEERKTGQVGVSNKP